MLFDFLVVLAYMCKMRQYCWCGWVRTAYVSVYIAYKLNKYIRRINEYQREHDEASRDISRYISNPINAYLLTKRLTSDWRIVEQVMSHDVSNG